MIIIKIMKFLELHASHESYYNPKIQKRMKKNNKILKFHWRITKNHENYRITMRQSLKSKKQLFPYENHENLTNYIILFKNDENHETIRIPRENYANH